MKKFFVIALLWLLGTPAFGQWQVPLNTVPIGRGPGVTGFTSVAPGTNGTISAPGGNLESLLFPEEDED